MFSKNYRSLENKGIFVKMSGLLQVKSYQQSSLPANKRAFEAGLDFCRMFVQQENLFYCENILTYFDCIFSESREIR